MASSNSMLTILMGGSVDPPGKPAKLPPLRILLLARILESLLVIIFTRPLQAVSSNVIGLVLVISQSHSIGLGIGYMCAIFHSLEMSPIEKHILMSFQRSRWSLSPR